MSKKKPALLTSDHSELLGRIKDRIRQSQVRAVLSVNAELLRLYWDSGRILDARQAQEGYGAAVFPRLSQDIQNELTVIKGFSERNIGRMIAYFRTYPNPDQILPQPVAKSLAVKTMPQAVAQLETGECGIPHDISPLAKGMGTCRFSVDWYVSPRDGGRFGSHRYLTFSSSDGVATPRYVCFYPLSPTGLFLRR